MFCRNSGSDEIPIDPDDPAFFKSLQRFREREICHALALAEFYYAEFCAGFTLLNRHDPVILQQTLKMAVFVGLLPQRVNFRSAGSLYDHSETGCLYAEQFHTRKTCICLAVGWEKSPPENYGKEDQTTVAAFLPWRGSSVRSP